MARGISHPLCSTTSILLLVHRLTIHVAGPDDPEFEIEQEVLDECAELSRQYGGTLITGHDAEAAVKVCLTVN